MSPTEAVTKIASATVESLRASPIVLALILLNVVFMSLIFITVRELRKHQHEQTMLLLNRCVPVGQTG